MSPELEKTPKSRLASVTCIACGGSVAEVTRETVDWMGVIRNAAKVSLEEACGLGAELERQPPPRRHGAEHTVAGYPTACL